MKIINKAPLNTQQGFTLIELVVVIVILGILAATAAPKFIDLTGDAKASTIEAVRGSVESATTMVHAKALIAGDTEGNGGLDLDGVLDASGNTTDEVVLSDSWPSSAITTWDEIIEINPDDFAAVANNTTIIWYHTQDEALNRNQAIATNCYVLYTESGDSNTRPAIEVFTDGC